MGLDEELAALGAEIEQVRQRVASVLRASGDESVVVESGCGAVDNACVSAAAVQRAMMKAVAHARRPHGPTITLRYSTNVDVQREAEVVSRDGLEFSVLCGGTYQKTFRLRTGREPGQETSYRGGWRGRTLASYWYADAEALAVVRAMPAGENDVSRAIRWIEEAK